MTPTANPLANWPSRGYDGPQPWEHDALGIPPALRDQVRQNPGSPNTVTPVISHNYPILTSGSVDPCVHDLGRKLGALGFPNTVSEGRNAFGHADQSVMTAVRGFRRAYGVRPDPSGFAGNEQTAENHLDPWTVEAILRARP